MSAVVIRANTADVTEAVIPDKLRRPGGRQDQEQSENRRRRSECLCELAEHSRTPRPGHHMEAIRHHVAPEVHDKHVEGAEHQLHDERARIREEDSSRRLAGRYQEDRHDHQGHEEDPHGDHSRKPGR